MKKEELRAMTQEELIELYLQSETMLSMYESKYNEMKRLISGISVNMEALCLTINKTL